MKYYLAAPFKRKAEARIAREALAHYGFECTSRWIDGHHGTDLMDPVVLQEEAYVDINDINVADVFIGLNYEEFKTEGAGRHFEHGYAFALQIPCFIVGVPSNVFHYMDHVYPTIEELIPTLKAWSYNESL